MTRSPTPADADRSEVAAAALESYPTPPGLLHEEWMNAGFLKLHPGPPVHVFTEARDEHFHCHPFPFTSHVGLGCYDEEVLLQRPDGTYYVKVYHRAAGTSHDMPAAAPHRLVALPDGVCITRCEYGPTERKSGEYILLDDGSLLHKHWDEEIWQPFAAPAT